MVDHLGTVRVRIEGAGLAAVPDDIAGAVFDILWVIVQRDRDKGFGVSSHTPRKTMQQLVPPKPKALDKNVS